MKQRKEPRLSHQTLRVMKAFLRRSTEGLAGSDLGRETSLPSGTLYPILVRLENAGWLSSEWELVEPSVAGRPRKRFYRLTGRGTNKARAALAELSVSEEGLGWTS